MFGLNKRFQMKNLCAFLRILQSSVVVMSFSTCRALTARLLCDMMAMKW